MAAPAGPVQAQIAIQARHRGEKEYIDEILSRISALVDLGMPKQAAEEQVAREIKEGAERREAPARRGFGRRAIIRNPERERLIRDLGRFNPPHANAPFMAINLEEGLRIPPDEQGARGEQRDYARAYNARQQAALAMPEYIENPAPPAPPVQPQMAPVGAPPAAPARPAREAAPERVARLPRAIQTAINMAERNVGEHLLPLQYARQIAEQGGQGFPENRQRYMNPYQQDVINRIREEGLRTFNENILPNLEGKFTGMGQHGSRRHAELARLAARDIQNEILGRQSQALHAGYGQAAQMHASDAARRMQLAEQMQNIAARRQAGNLADIAGLTDVGKQQQAQEQQNLDVAYQDYMRQKYEPHKLLEWQANIANKFPASFTEYQTSAAPQNPQLYMNTAGNIGGLASNLLGGLMQRPLGRRMGGPIPIAARRRIK